MQVYMIFIYLTYIRYRGWMESPVRQRKMSVLGDIAIHWSIKNVQKTLTNYLLVMLQHILLNKFNCPVLGSPYFVKKSFLCSQSSYVFSSEIIKQPKFEGKSAHFTTYMEKF